MTLDIQIAPGSASPIYQQIVDQICRAAASGALSPGEQLPSVRTLAERLVVNPNTIARAYTELITLGVVASQRGKGLYIEPRRKIYSDEERTRRLEQAIETFLQQVLLLDFTPREIVEALEHKLAAANSLLPEGDGDDRICD